MEHASPGLRIADEGGYITFVRRERITQVRIGVYIVFLKNTATEPFQMSRGPSLMGDRLGQFSLFQSQTRQDHRPLMGCYRLTYGTPVRIRR